MIDRTQDKVGPTGPPDGWSRLEASVLASGRLADSEVQELCALKNQHWPYSLREQRLWWNANSDPSDLVVRLLADGRATAFLRLRSRVVACEDKDWPSRCATEVCVDRSVQGRGLGRRLMQEATCVLDQDTPPLGYLLCTAAQEGFYAKCGWSTIDNVAIRPTANQPCRPLDEHERCLMHDPMGVLHGSIVLTGTVF